MDAPAQAAHAGKSSLRLNAPAAVTPKPFASHQATPQRRSLNCGTLPSTVARLPPAPPLRSDLIKTMSAAEASFGFTARGRSA